jgi:hypothetical protein
MIGRSLPKITSISPPSIRVRGSLLPGIMYFMEKEGEGEEEAEEEGGR